MTDSQAFAQTKLDNAKRWIMDIILPRIKDDITRNFAAMKITSLSLDDIGTYVTLVKLKCKKKEDLDGLIDDQIKGTALDIFTSEELVRVKRYGHLFWELYIGE